MKTTSCRRSACVIALALITTFAAAADRSGVSFSLEGADASVQVLASDFRRYHDTGTDVDAVGLAPFFFRDGSSYYGRQAALVPLTTDSSFFIQTNPEVLPVFLVRGLPAEAGAERTFDEVVYCPHGATAVRDCAKPQKVEFVVRMTDGRTETSSKSGYRLEYKLFAVMDRTGARTIRID